MNKNKNLLISYDGLAVIGPHVYLHKNIIIINYNGSYLLYEI